VVALPEHDLGRGGPGGQPPHVPVSSLSLSLGNVDPNTGMPTLAGPYQAYVFTGTLTSGSESVTGVSNLTGLIAGESVVGTGIPAGTTIVTVSSSTGSITLPADATASGSQSLTAANPTATPDPDLMLASTFGRGSFAINLAPLILGDEVTVSPTTAGTGTDSSPVVTSPITISGSSEISGFGNATWITVEDVTNPASLVVIAGFNPADPVPTPNSSNSTNALGNFSIPFNPASYYMTNGPKTIEIFATNNAGSVGNKVTYSFTLNDNSVPPSLQMLPADIKGTLNGNPVTNIENPEFLGATGPGVTITVFKTQEVNGVFPPPPCSSPCRARISAPTARSTSCSRIPRIRPVSRPYPMGPSRSTSRRRIPSTPVSARPRAIPSRF